MTNKFEIGSQWKTRGGWRAVVVDNEGRYITVWHKKAGEDILLHYMNGRLQSSCPGDFDLIEPWVEPKVHDVWINVYKHKYEKGWICFGEDSDGYPMATKEDADKCAKEGRLACVNVKFKEGEGL